MSAEGVHNSVVREPGREIEFLVLGPIEAQKVGQTLALGGPRPGRAVAHSLTYAVIGYLGAAVDTIGGCQAG